MGEAQVGMGNWLVILLGGACMLGVVIAGVAAVALFMQRGKPDQGGSRSGLLIALAVAVCLAVCLLCGGALFVFTFLGHQVRTSTSDEIERLSGQTTTRPEPDRLTPPQPSSLEPAGDIEGPVDR